MHCISLAVLPASLVCEEQEPPVVVITFVIQLFAIYSPTTY